MVTLAQSLESGRSVKSLVSHCYAARFLGPCAPCFLRPLPVFLPSWALGPRTGSDQRITHQRRDPFQRAALTQIFQKGNPTPSVSAPVSIWQEKKEEKQRDLELPEFNHFYGQCQEHGKAYPSGRGPGALRTLAAVRHWLGTPLRQPWTSTFPRFLSAESEDRLSRGGFRRGLWILSLETERLSYAQTQ